ncbi:MAG: cob(I)yrinic acid a,c-diamide adenosyltransferase [Acidimicrobiia bacterium]|nr:cob(I)yrinic acid a,c-diamide adenosyltransferase [bacterium]MXX01207.1 cob(I)yrinic acid a,c-diamide adenosyltransferase [Acidimicrobiia bacterium]MDE0675663.1 cob(I)yrinic acid a,c-diamide adenosyltransferase [bacterium]MXX46549.1 cob(I)yrinic acid a,c-diamide adenosyltransferase [Acidimicrobiia bacterium]MYA39751.1 cob(I)yrinic acid a,c-diamide adenosyltransferase [Acidimicrobiia bacterium]
MSKAPRTEDPRRRDVKRAPSVVVINTGDGKGKSTAAMGMVMRSVARNWQVAVVQFIKSGKWKVGEEKVGQRLGVEWVAGGDGFSWDSEDLDRSAELNRETWELARRRIEAGKHRLVVLDEITYPINWGWIDEEEVAGTIINRPAHVNVVITGRDAPARLVEIAHTVTEMQLVKHAYQQGIRTIRGIDF